MRKAIVCLAFSAVITALTSCGKYEKDPTPDKTIHNLPVSGTTTASEKERDNAVTTTVEALKSETKKENRIQKLSYVDSDESEDDTEDTAVPQPVETVASESSTENSTSNTSKGSDTSSGSSTSQNTSSSESETSGGWNTTSTSTACAASSTTVSTTVTTVPVVDNPEFDEIKGEWVFERGLSVRTFSVDGYINIKGDGSFEFHDNVSGDSVSGHLEKRTMYTDDGTEKVYYDFFDDNNVKWKECRELQDTGIWLLEGDTERMERKDDINLNNITNELCGEWEYQEIDRSDGEYKTVGKIVITDGHKYSYYPDNGSDEKNGIIITKTERYSDGTDKYYYALCENGDIDNIWKSFFCDQEDPDIYYAGNGGECRFVRKDKNEYDKDFDMLAYKWDYQEYKNTGRNEMYVTVGYLTIEENGHYQYISLDGKEEKYGIIKEDYFAGRSTISLYDYGQHFWNSFIFEHYRDTCYPMCSGDTDARIMYHENDNTEGDHFIGIWEDEYYHVSCERLLDGYMVYISCENEYGNNNLEHSEWRFFCMYDGNVLVCDGKGEYDTTVFMVNNGDEVTQLSYDEVRDCSAVFRFDNGNLVWENTDSGEKKIFSPQDNGVG